MTFNDVNLRSGVEVAILSVHCSMAATTPYALDLGGQAKKKVPGQVKLIEGLDPFQLASNPDCGAATRDLPPVRANDIVSYLVMQTRISIDTIIIIITTVKC